MSSTIKDTEIKLSYQAPDDTQAEDKAKITVWNIKFNDPVITQYIPRPETGNPYYNVEAQMHPSDAFDGKLYWTWQDPSPSNTGQNPQGGFFQQYIENGYSWNLNISDPNHPYSIPHPQTGVVKCKFYLPNGAGDDGKVVVSTQPNGKGEKAISGIMTVVGVNLMMDNLSEEAEIDTGSYIFLNWDDDNNNDTCDMDETGAVTNEDDVIPLNLSITPGNTNQGTIELYAPAGSSKIKVWTSATKGTQINLPKTWNLAQETVPTTLYVEGVEKSGSERDVTLKLKYSNTVNGVQKNTYDDVKITVVFIKKGDAVYRDKLLLFTPPINYNHVGIIRDYIGRRCRADIVNYANYTVYDMQRNGMRVTNLYTFSTENNNSYYGPYTSSAISYYYRNYILKTLDYLKTRNIRYPDEFIPYAIKYYSGECPSGAIGINEIGYLRCDALIEVCYEYNNLMVWRWVGNQESFDSVMTYPAKHNDRPDLTIDPYTEFSPAAQRGAFLNDNTSFVQDWSSIISGVGEPYEPMLTE